MVKRAVIDVQGSWTFVRTEVYPMPSNGGWELIQALCISAPSYRELESETLRLSAFCFVEGDARNDVTPH